MLLAFAAFEMVRLLVPQLREFFGLRGMRGVDFGVIVLVVLVWMYALRWVWEARIFDRFFGYDARDRPGRGTAV